MHPSSDARFAPRTHPSNSQLDPPLPEHGTQELACAAEREEENYNQGEGSGSQAARITRFLHEDAAGDYLREPQHRDDIRINGMEVINPSRQNGVRAFSVSVGLSVLKLSRVSVRSWKLIRNALFL